MITDPALLAATIAAITALAFWLDRRFGWGQKIGATLLVILFGALLSNAGVVPAASPVYDVITGPITSLAIVWLLFAVDVRDLRDAGPAMLVAFAIAVTATATGALVASWVFAGSFGEDGWKLAGVMTGTYSGGGLNFVAVGRALDLPPELFAAATASDNVMTAAWFGATMLLPVWLGRYYRARRGAGGAAGAALERDVPEAGGPGRTIDQPIDLGEAGERGAGDAAHPFLSTTRLRVLDASVLLALGFGLIWLSGAVADVVPGVPAIVWLTTSALVVGHTPWVRRLDGAMHLGSLGLHFFFAIIGILSRVAEIARVGAAVFWFTALVVAVHGLITYAGCRLARLDVATTSVASQAAVGGPSSALALAVGRGWTALVLPGVAVGLLGYAVGNYLGLAVAYLVRAWLG